MNSHTPQPPLSSAHTATGADTSHTAPVNSPAGDIPSGGLLPTDIERVYLNYRARWMVKLHSAIIRNNTRDKGEAQDHIDNAARYLLTCKGETQ